MLHGKHTTKTLDKFPKESTIDVGDNDPINIDEEINDNVGLNIDTER